MPLSDLVAGHDGQSRAGGLLAGKAGTPCACAGPRSVNPSKAAIAVSIDRHNLVGCLAHLPPKTSRVNWSVLCVSDLIWTFELLQEFEALYSRVRGIEIGARRVVARPTDAYSRPRSTGLMPEMKAQPLAANLPPKPRVNFLPFRPASCPSSD
jgi:hypothetical protein